MKRILLAITVVLLSFQSYAQEQNTNEEKHLKFKGIEMNIPIQEFANRLIGQGYKHVISDDEYGIMLKGKFGGYTADVVILGNEEGITCGAGANITCKSWSHIREVYTDFHQSLEQKYGRPVHSHMAFLPPYKEGDGKELVALKNDKLWCFARWEFPEGLIILQMSMDVEERPVVQLVYNDALNMPETTTMMEDI